MRDCVVVGGGLAGLACAQRLATSGRSVLVLEADEAPGGRARTVWHRGRPVDRGFQVLFRSYPQTRDLLQARSACRAATCARWTAARSSSAWRRPIGWARRSSAAVRFGGHAAARPGAADAARRVGGRRGRRRRCSESRSRSARPTSSCATSASPTTPSSVSSGPSSGWSPSTAPSARTRATSAS